MLFTTQTRVAAIAINMNAKPALPSAKSLFTTQSPGQNVIKKEIQTTNVSLPWNRGQSNGNFWKNSFKNTPSFKSTSNYSKNGNFPAINHKKDNNLLNYNDLQDEDDDYRSQLMNFLKFKEDLKFIQYKDRMITLDTPEDIAKWREERKANYPTIENVEEKKSLKNKDGQIAGGKKKKRKNKSEKQFEVRKRNLTLFDKVS